jgi:hypothetical protein
LIFAGARTEIIGLVVLTEKERRVADILVGCGVVADLDAEPIPRGGQRNKMAYEIYPGIRRRSRCTENRETGFYCSVRDGPQYNPGAQWEEVKQPAHL